MKKYLYITAITLPFVTGPVWGQEATMSPTDEAPAEQMEGQAPEAGADMNAQAPGADTSAPGSTDTAPAEGMAGETQMDAAPADGMQAETSDGDAAAPTSDAVVPQQDSAEMLGDWLLSTSVTSPDGETIGSIKDFIITGEGQITAVILGVGGFLGMGEKDIAVDYDELDIQYDGNAIQLEMTRDEADAAPEYQYRDKQTPPPATGDAMGATGTDMNSGTGMTGGEAGTAGTELTE
ncbi:PRC-barrel domain-containing protein [Alloyangia pacifica]|uniref:PRC-barrel domain-containing protein n=1 Tax=Alloyangia pacifica TaxID=311180 RepID=A0A1I6QE84_9RHOB|nr:PRC-barrel domain-containing protein [Alloyangia pacifica]SDF87992.1 PRC-barrel domain-containing protein [Alloyangia pacifica]SFS50823.1 PRC-barrel domain-containing protein [Alloyangia pacifica]